MRIVRAAFAVAVAAGLPACWVLLDIEERPVADGRDGDTQPNDGAPSDTAPTERDVTPSDAPADADSGDAGCFYRRDAQAVTFADVDGSSDGAAAIARLGEAGVLDPCATNSLFCPDQNVRRREAIRWAVRIATDDTFAYGCTPYFNDVPPTDPDFPYVQKAFELGITVGFGGGFGPDIDTGRAGIAVFSVQASGVGIADAATTPYYGDVSPDASYFAVVQVATATGMMSACGGGDAGADASFCPSSPATRRVAAIAFDRARELR